MGMGCEAVWGSGQRGTLSSCGRKGNMANVPIFKSVYCFNNGTGLCKGLSGRFELLFNVFEDKVIGPYAGYDATVDSNGYHKRVPIAYTKDGSVLTSDRVINWANLFTKNSLKTNLLNVGGINWCDYCESDNWPYRSAIKDPNSNGRYHIYFFNKQSCIIDTKASPSAKAPTQYNTRFTHKSTFRVDQDMNPLIFVMEDNKASGQKYRMVKNKRQHWSETNYNVIDLPGSNNRHFVKIDDFETQPQIVGDGKHILSVKAYFATNETENLCLSDGYFYRMDNVTRNNKLLQNYCGLDEVEMADLNAVEERTSKTVYEADLHCLPKHPPRAERFFGVDFSDDKDWLEFAKHGYAFSAFTTRPIAGKSWSVNVIMLYAVFQEPIENEYDEYYPRPYVSNYTATYNEQSNTWDNDRETNKLERKDMNFVDDIAYLPTCKTILIVYGPLYTEMTETDLMDRSVKTLIGSVYDLGLWEMTNAFFAVKDTIYFYHRTNYVVEHKYSCGSNDGQASLVTAKRSSSYMARHGANMPSIFPKITDSISCDGNPEMTFFEETFFKKLGIFNGDTGSPEAPDPKSFPYDEGQITPAPAEASNLWLYLIIGLAVLIILTMCIIYLATRRRRRRRQKAEADRLSNVTQRSSGLAGTSGVSGAVTNRSGMSEASGASGPAPTLRSANISRGSSRPEFSKSGLTKKPNSTATASTNRSGMSKRSPSSGTSRSSRASSKATARTGLSNSNSNSSSPKGSRSHSRSKK